jgi:hypothetical protein
MFKITTYSIKPVLKFHSLAEILSEIMGAPITADGRGGYFTYQLQQQYHPVALPEGTREDYELDVYNADRKRMLRLSDMTYKPTINPNWNEMEGEIKYMLSDPHHGLPEYPRLTHPYVSVNDGNFEFLVKEENIKFSKLLDSRFCLDKLVSYAMGQEMEYRMYRNCDTTWRGGDILPLSTYCECEYHCDCDAEDRFDCIKNRWYAGRFPTDLDLDSLVRYGGHTAMYDALINGLKEGMVDNITWQEPEGDKE